MQFLRTIKNKRDEGYTTVYLNETWVDINHKTIDEGGLLLSISSIKLGLLKENDR
jgi:hypothetical protein